MGQNPLSSMAWPFVHDVFIESTPKVVLHRSRQQASHTLLIYLIFCINKEIEIKLI